MPFSTFSSKITSAKIYFADRIYFLFLHHSVFEIIYYQNSPIMARKKFTLEYIIRSSPSILFEFVSQPDSLAQWFSDFCDAQDDIFIFGWNGSFQRARQVDLIEEESVKYHWEHGNKEEYFSFRVYKSEIANDTILEISDFADAKEVKEQSFLWDKQIEDLKHAIGA